MIDFESAKRIAWEYVRHISQPHSGTIVIAEENTRDEEFGWVFFFDSKACIETGDFRYALGGNAPIIVSRENGEVYVTGTARSIEEYAANYLRFGDPHLNPGPSLTIDGWETGANAVQAIRAIGSATEFGLARTKRYIDDVLEGKSVEFECVDAESSAKLVAALISLGFCAVQKGE